VLAPDPDLDGRVDLHVRLYSGGHQSHTFYHRPVGLTMLRCWWDDEGVLLEEPYAVAASAWGRHQVHHRGSTWDVSLRNLAVVTKPCHLLCQQGLRLPMPPVGWGKW